MLKNLVASMIGLLEERESSSPQDELEQITGMKTGNSEPPDNVTLQRLLPDFSKPDDAHRRGHRQPERRSAQPA